MIFVLSVVIPTRTQSKGFTTEHRATVLVVKEKRLIESGVGGAPGFVGFEDCIEDEQELPDAGDLNDLEGLSSDG